MRQVCVNRRAVLEAIKNLQESCTTQELANVLSTPERLIPERSVRASVAWLVLSGYLIKSANLVIRRDVKGCPYKVWLYTWTGKDKPITGHRKDGLRRNKEERDAQQWDDRRDAGVFLQNIFFQMKGR